MPRWIIIVPFLNVRGMTLFPFILLKDKELATDKTIMNHEMIHLWQELELLILPFFIIYLLHYLLNLCIYRNHDKAYRNIIFEREAYRHECDLGYLKRRKFWGWL
jgi:hypothetical protein